MGILIKRVNLGFGRHNYYVLSANREEVTRLGMISQLLWALAVGMCKTSIAIMFLRIKKEKKWKIFLYSSVLLILVAVIFTFISKFVECRPAAALWDPKIRGAKCWEKRHKRIHVYINSVIVIGTDILYSCLPITFIRQLNRPLREKIVLCFLMGLGFVASAASVAKMVQIKNLGKKEDSLWVTVDIVIFSIVEEQLGIIAASVPCLKSTFEHVLYRLGLLPSFHRSTPKCRKGDVECLREPVKLESLNGASQPYTSQESVGDGKSEEGIPPARPAKITNKEAV